MRSVATQGFKKITADDGRFRLKKDACAEDQKLALRDAFQSNTHQRHDSFGCNYHSLPEVSTAMALGQVEKLAWFVELRQHSAVCYRAALKDCNWLLSQQVPTGDENS